MDEIDIAVNKFINKISEELKVSKKDISLKRDVQESNDWNKWSNNIVYWPRFQPSTKLE